MNRSRDEYGIDRDFQTEESLQDGTKITLRMLSRSDQELLARGFEQLSERSRYQRFLTLKQSLSAHELDYLVDVDGYDHVAIGAAIEHPDGAEEGIGVARFIRYEDQPTVAEVAVTVIDAYQGQGLGRIMLRYLARAARERDVESFRADTFANNVRMRALFDELGPTEVLERAGPVLTLDIPLEQELSSTDEPRQSGRP